MRLLVLSAFVLCFIISISSQDDAQKREPMSEKDLKKVMDHYTNYPYPTFKEDRVLVSVEPQLSDLNHYIFAGRGDFGRERPFRILIAGGGTGAGLLHYARVFDDTPQVSIVYLDFSKTSLDIARSQVERYGLNRSISFIHNSIYNIPKLNLGSFDLIDCMGVLHHLLDPNEGLRILKERLAVGGGMFLMLYAYFGRQGVYSMQGSLKILQQRVNSTSQEEELIRGAVLYNNHVRKSWIHGAGVFTEARDPSGFYDLYLNKQDRAYTLPELYEYIEDKGGLQIVHFANSHYREVLNECPEFLKGLTKKKRRTLNEMLLGLETKQTIYVSRSKNDSEASIHNPDNVPFFVVKNPMIMSEFGRGKTKSQRIKVTTDLNNYFLDRKILIPVSKYTHTFLKLITLNRYTIGDIVDLGVKQHKKKQAEPKNLRKKVSQELTKTLKSLILHGFLLLRHKSAPKMNHSGEPVQIMKAELVQI